MSTYNKLTKNPKTGEFENATWMDDYFGRHHYGVRFPGGEVIDPDKVELETMDMPDNTKKEICTSCKDGKMHLCTVHYSYIDKNKEEKLEFHGIKVIKDETKREGEWELKHTPFPQPESKEEVCPCGGKIVEGKCTRPVVNSTRTLTNAETLNSPPLPKITNNYMEEKRYIFHSRGFYWDWWKDLLTGDIVKFTIGKDPNDY